MKPYKVLLSILILGCLLAAGALAAVGCGNSDCDKVCERCAPFWAECSANCDACGVGACNMNADCGTLTVCILANCGLQ